MGKKNLIHGLVYKTDDKKSQESFTYLLNSLETFTKLDSIHSQAFATYHIYDLVSRQNKLDIDPKEYGEKFINYALSSKNKSSLFRARAHLIKADFSWEKDSIEIVLEHYKNCINELKKIHSKEKIARIQMNIGLLYKDKTTQNDSACHYYSVSLNKFIELDKKALITINYNNQSELYKKMGDSLMAKIYLEKKGVKISKLPLKTQEIIYNNKIGSYQKNKEQDSIIKYLELLISIKDSIDYQSQQEAFIKYQTAEKEKEALVQKAKTRQITIGLTATLLLGSIIAFLVYRNTKRKQRIAEQDRELQIQKTETILKEKELETINAMVSGQEKERLRLAGELHDNLGSTLATVRMQVENLERNLDKVEDPKALLKKTNALVNEAYTKVRTISHERNSGVIAKEGLLPAIQKLARTVSSNNNLQIEVQDFGLENRISNDMEITIFRIIQELVTNIVKHAQATEASISLTQHDSELNMMIEDNGKGFKVGKLEEKDGMGLGNIERRVEHLEGSMEVDSALGRGTNISIDIPL